MNLPVGSARGWVSAETDEVVELPVQLGGTRITAKTDQTLTRPAFVLERRFAVAATFERTAGASPAAAYGLTVGSVNGVATRFAVLIRPDGAVSIQRGNSVGASRGAWQPTSALRAPRVDGTGSDRLEIRVEDTQVRILVNRQEIAAVTIEAGELDGSPGVHVSAGADVVVQGFAIEGAPPPGSVK
jgi:hypothetical protein